MATATGCPLAGIYDICCVGRRFLSTRATQGSKVVLATTVLLGLNLIILPYFSLYSVTKLKAQQAAFVVIGTEVCGLYAV